MRLHTALLIFGLASTAVALPKGQRNDVQRLSSVLTHSYFTDGPSFTLPSVPPRPPTATTPPPVGTGGVLAENRNDRPPQASGTGASRTASPPPKPTGTEKLPFKPSGIDTPSSSVTGAGSSAKVKGKVGVVKAAAGERGASQMPYNLSRWASYPRLSEPSPTLITLLKHIKDSKNTVFSSSEARNLLTTGISSASVSQQLSISFSSIPEDASIKEKSSQISKQTDSINSLKMSTQKSSNVLGTSVSPASSDETFQTAKSEEQGTIDSLARETKSINSSKESTPTSDATEKPKSSQQVEILQVTAFVDKLPATSLEGAEPVPAILGSKHSSHHNLGTIFHSKGERSGPPVPPKPSQYVPTSHKADEENQKQPAIQELVQVHQPAESRPPTMLIFKVLGTRTNPNTRECEYHILYNWSGSNPRFPNGPVVEEVFTFEDLSMHRAVITRLRVWHSTHIGVSKDPRVEEMKYRMSPAEYTETNRYPWPPFDPRGWYRCLIWGNFGLDTDSE
ncbi:hypothetical protein TWF751_004644 [Orbilia oligospora]|nr:hypothetical protein TWF751_004644 [Orbilia oligospora]